MGIVAMKVLGAGMLAPFSPEVPAAACRYVLNDERVHMLTIGMRFTPEIDANVATFTGDTAYSSADAALLESASKQVLEQPAVRGMPVV